MMMSIEEVLKKFYEQNEPKTLASIFEAYMKTLGARKYDGRRKDNSNTYMIDGTSYGWNKVECYYFRDNHVNHGDSDLELIMRKKQGDYLILGRQLMRAYEISCGTVLEKNSDGVLLASIVKRHPRLFTMMRSAIASEPELPGEWQRNIMERFEKVN